MSTATLTPAHRQWRTRVFAATWLSYAGFYFCRKPWSVAKSAIGEAGHLSTDTLGHIGAANLLAYAIGHPRPVSVFVDTFGTGRVSDEAIAAAVQQVFSFKPADIVKQLNLLRPIYRQTTNYGHFGKKGLPWEQTTKVAALRAAVK